MKEISKVQNSSSKQKMSKIENEIKKQIPLKEFKPKNPEIKIQEKLQLDFKQIWSTAAIKVNQTKMMLGMVEKLSFDIDQSSTHTNKK